MRRLHKKIFGLCAGLILAGCAGVGIGGDHIRWTEEVRLSDGKVIQIQRHVELTDSGFPVQKRGFVKYHEICYPPMNIHWKSRGGYQPDIFDIVDGKAYMHVPVTAQVNCYEQNSPASGAIYFVWDGDQWKQIAYDEFPSTSEWNLEMGIKGSAGHKEDDMHGLVTLNYKERPSSLRTDQKRFGWKRMNESYDSREGCKRHGNIGSGCVDETCRYVTDTPGAPISIFSIDTHNTCLP